MRRHAEISACGHYRYLLERRWSDAPLIQAKILTVCMLNPSTADAERDDATIRWLIGYGRKRGYDALRVVNLAAYRATSPQDMLTTADPHGPECLSYLVRFTSAREVLCAWGANGPKLPKYRAMVAAMAHAKTMCLAVTKHGEPVHPLRRSHSLEMQPWGHFLHETKPEPCKEYDPQ